MWRETVLDYWKLLSEYLLEELTETTKKTITETALWTENGIRNIPNKKHECQ